MSSEPQASKANGAEPVPETPKAKTLVQKLAEIVSVIDHVEKSGRNEFQKYNYVKAADVAWVVRKALCERNIYLVADTVFIRNYEIPAREGVMQAVDVTMEFSFHDGDDPTAAPIVLHSYGTGTDKGDKAVYKAQTGALKYGLRHAFLIPDESDPEGDTATDKATDAKAVGKEKIAQLKEKMGQSAPQSEPEANTEPSVLFCVLTQPDPTNTAMDVYEVSGHSDVMEKHKGLLLLHGKRVVTGRGDTRKAVVHMTGDGLAAFSFDFQKRGGIVKPLKPI